MIRIVTKYIVIIFFGTLFLFPASVSLQAQNTDIEKKIREYEQKLNEIRQQKNTLASQIQEMDTQISLTSLTIQRTEQRIIETQHEIEKLSTRIENLDASLDSLSKLLLERIIEGYKTQTISLLDIVLDAYSLRDLTNKIKYQKTTQNNMQRLLLQVQEAKVNYEEQKKTREQKKSEMNNLIASLENQKLALKTQQIQKKRLLTDTNNDEATYQSLLAEARAQLKGFSQFVNSQGGSSILTNQTFCDDWGCYYNQRDSQWGNVIINGRNDCDGPCSLSKVGCLITSVAMVVSYLGNRSITPQDIVNNPTNFWPGTAYLNKGDIYANGLRINRTTIAGSLSPELTQNGPVIVGIRYGPFGTHFVVIKSFSDGKYIMHDPYTEGGKDKNFTDFYSLESVFEVDRVSI